MYSEVEIKIPKLSTVKWKLRSLAIYSEVGRVPGYLKVEWEESFAISIEVGITVTIQLSAAKWELSP